MLKLNNLFRIEIYFLIVMETNSQGIAAGKGLLLRVSWHGESMTLMMEQRERERGWLFSPFIRNLVLNNKPTPMIKILIH